MRVVEVGQYFVTKNTGNLTQYRSVACREYTLPRDDWGSQPKGWIQGNLRIGPVLEVTTSFQHFKYGIEIRIKSVGQDNSQSWVRISYGTNKCVIDSNHNNTEAPADTHEDQASQTSVKVIAARPKAKAKPQKREPVDVPSIIPMHERKWIDIEPSEPSLAAHEVSKKVISLLRHNQTLQSEDNEAIEFHKIKFHFRNHHSVWSDDRWKACLAAGGGSNRRYQCCSDNSGTILYLRALQGHSGRNLIDPMLQDNAIIQRGLFHHIYHIGCAFNLHSIINNGLIPMKILNILTSLYHIEHNICTVHGRNIKTQYFGLILILRFERDWHSIKHDRMQFSSKEHFQLIVFQKLWDWRLEKSCMRNLRISSTTTKDLITTRSRLDQREWWIGLYSWTTASR